MTKYSIDTDPRKIPNALIAMAALLISIKLKPFFAYVGFELAAPTAFLIFGALYFLFDKFLWKWFECLHHVPDLDGKWSGLLDRGTERGEAGGRKSTVDVVITQSWTEMEIVLQGANGALSVSKVVGVFVKNKNLIEVRYGYVKITSEATKKWDKSSTGYTTLWLTTDGNVKTLNGNYFSDNLRSGTFRLMRVREPRIAFNCSCPKWRLTQRDKAPHSPSRAD